MKSHDLARKLLEMPNNDIKLSVDVSTSDDDSSNRIFSDTLYEVQDDSWMDSISLLFVDPERNY